MGLVSRVVIAVWVDKLHRAHVPKVNEYISIGSSNPLTW